MYIQLFNGYTIKIIGSPGKKILTSMFLEYYDAKILQVLRESETPNLYIFLGSRGIEDSKDLELCSESLDSKVPVLISILSKKDYEFVTEFCKTHNLRLYIAPLKKIISMYKYLNFPFFDYIHLSLAASASKLSKEEKVPLITEQKAPFMSLIDPIINIKNTFSIESNKDVRDSFNESIELIGVSPEKSFHIRSHTNESVEFVWEPGTYEVGNRLLMEWLRNNKSKDVYTIIDIDEIPSNVSEIKDYLLPFTTLGIKQKGFLIVNSDMSDNQESVPFDYHVYTTLMELWNNKHYIPKRKDLLEPIPGYTETIVSGTIVSNFDPKFEESILKPPIFIIDFYDSIKNFIYKISNCIVLYIGKEENYKNIIKN
jgi:hypothetical protein